MRLTRAEIDDVDALLPQFVGLGYNGHGGARFDSVDALG
jgi:hypothetical protein